MAPKFVVLDTSAVSELIDDQRPGHPAASRGLERLAAELPLDAIVVPTLVVYEIRRGLIHSNSERRRLRFEQFLRAFAFVDDFDEESAEAAASLWAQRRAAGLTAGEMDLMILASAVALQAELVTEDTGFPTAPGVTLLRWADVLSRPAQSN